MRIKSENTRPGNVNPYRIVAGGPDGGKIVLNYLQKRLLSGTNLWYKYGILIPVMRGRIVQ